MIGRLKQLLASPLAETPRDPGTSLRRCLVALLVEAARADFDDHPEEAAGILRLVGRQFGLTEPEAGDLLAEAREAVEKSVSLHEFTAPLHREMSYPEKLQVVEMLWTVALQDRSLDKYEEYLVGKVAELLYVARGDVVRLRWQALQGAEGGPGTGSPGGSPGS